MPGQDLQTADTHVVLARNCKGLTLRDLTVNGACLSLGSAGAQTHGIFVEDDCEDVVLERVEVFQTAGDAVRLKGEPAHEVRRVWVQGCRLVQNRRTGVAFQRCVEFVWIRDCYIETIPPSTQAGIDFEPSPPEGPPVLVAPVPLENRIRQVTCRSSGCQAARTYSLIRPLRTGFRRICRVSRSVTVAG